ncbi:hypothetical protein RHODOSMS8_02293 [Rhodobiaceae bacterium]|nr:hypothetical protein RHODOSMS8_02293 [Rhodobiaceae bacterium]
MPGRALHVREFGANANGEDKKTLLLMLGGALRTSL